MGTGSNNGFIGGCLYFIAQVFIVLAIIAFLPGLPPDEEFSSYRLDESPNIPHKKIKNVEVLFQDQIKGPEDFAVYKNELYTGAHGGHVYKISNGKLVPVIKFGKDCDGFHEEEICGRPLGIEFDSKGFLYVVDAYYGIMKVNISTGAVNRIASIEDPIDGVLPKLPNGITLSRRSNDFYWTDSSITHELRNALFTTLSNGNGRVIKYNAAKGKHEVLLKNLHFPNGIVLSKDESFLVISETMRGRLIKYYLKGPKVGQTEVFAQLPGLPDNIKYIDGRISVPVVAKRNPILTILADWPSIRRLISRIGTLAESLVSFIEFLHPNPIIKIVSHWIGHFESVNAFVPPVPSVLYFLNEDGKIVDALAADDNKTHHISSIISFQGYYYLGSPYNNYIVRAKITK